MLVSLKEITNCEDYYIDDQTFQIVSFKQKKYENGKRTFIYTVSILISFNKLSAYAIAVFASFSVTMT